MPGARGVDNMDFAELRRLTEQCKKVQPYFLGDFWPLTPYTLDESVWMAWQFNRPEAGAGMVQVFRRDNSFYESARFKLRGLEANSRYKVGSLDEPDKQQEFTGRELMGQGLPVAIAVQPGAIVVTYEKAGGN